MSKRIGERINVFVAVIVLVLVGDLGLAQFWEATPTFTPNWWQATATPTRTPTKTPTRLSPTATRTRTPTATVVQSRTVTPTPTRTGTRTLTPTRTRTATITRTPTRTPTPTITPTRTPIGSPTPTPTPLPCFHEVTLNVESVEGTPTVMEWYKAIGDNAYPSTPDGYGFSYSVELLYPRIRVRYIGRYQHEITPGVLYTDVQEFSLRTLCPVDLIFGDGFESGTTSAWSSTQP